MKTQAADHNFSCLLGLDYVEEALTLAKSLAVSKNVQGSIGHKVSQLNIVIHYPTLERENYA